jgi:hypothetical protein
MKPIEKVLTFDLLAIMILAAIFLFSARQVTGNFVRDDGQAQARKPGKDLSFKVNTAGIEFEQALDSFLHFHPEYIVPDSISRKLNHVPDCVAHCIQKEKLIYFQSVNDVFVLQFRDAGRSRLHDGKIRWIYKIVENNWVRQDPDQLDSLEAQKALVRLEQEVIRKVVERKPTHIISSYDDHATFGKKDPIYRPGLSAKHKTQTIFVLFSS